MRNILVYVLGIIFVICIGIFVWRDTLNNEFVYDDNALIVNNEYIHSIFPVTKFFSSETSSVDLRMNKSEWRPLTRFILALTYHIYGLNPKSYHLINFIFHILNSILVFSLVLLIYYVKYDDLSVSSILVGFITSVIFLIHPVQVETVAWATQISNILFLFFYLIGLIFYVLYTFSLRFRVNNKLCISYFIISVYCFILSLFCKEMAISFLFIIIGYNLILMRESVIEAFRRSVIYFIVLFIFVLVRGIVIGMVGQPSVWASFIPRMLTMVKGFSYYIRLLFIPYPLSIEYLFSIKSVLDLEVLFYGILLLGIFYLGYRLSSKYPLISFGIYIFFISLLPASNIIPINTTINERYLYLGVIGFGLVISQLIINFFDIFSFINFLRFKLKLVIKFLVILVLFILYSFISVVRIRDWKDHWSLVTANLKTCPQSATLHYGMGKAYASKGMYKEAIREFELCLKIDPEYERVLSDLGIDSDGVSEIDNLVDKYRQTLQKRVDFFDGLHNLGLAYFNNGEYRKSVKVLEEACRINSEDLEAKTNLAVAYAYTGEIEKGINLCKEVLNKNPGMTKTRYNLGLFYAVVGLLEEAEEQYKEVLRIEQDHNLARISLREIDRIRGSERISLLNSVRQGLEVDGEKSPEISKGTEVAQVTSFIMKHFSDPMINTMFSVVGGICWQKTDKYYTPNIGHSGSIQTKETLKAEDLQVLETFPKIECELKCMNPRVYLGNNYSDGYKIEYGGIEISVKPEGYTKDAGIEFESTVAVYKDVYSMTDVLYVVLPEDIVEKLFLIKEHRVAEKDTDIVKFRYDIEVRDKLKEDNLGINNNQVVINTNGEIEIGGLVLSRPVIFDTTGKKVDGWYELKENKELFLCFNSAGLKYPVLVDPVWRKNTSVMSSSRFCHTATLLPNGKVLIVGGHINGVNTYLSTAELYDPETGEFVSTGSMSVARARHTATLLPNGKVLIAGGKNSNVLSTAELYDPQTGTFSMTSNSMSIGRWNHVATLLFNGKVLISGGTDSSGNVLSTAELYDPQTNTFTATGSMTDARERHIAVLLPDGKVLVSGKQGGSLTAELYNPETGTFSTTGNMKIARGHHTATLLPNGKVLITGGVYPTGDPLSTAELYDPKTGTFSTTAGVMSYRRGKHVAVLLPNGKVLIAGGFDSSTHLSTAELYDPQTNTFTTTGSMFYKRIRMSATLLPDGKVLIVGGDNSPDGVYYSSAELYDPKTSTFSFTNSMSTARGKHTATLLPNGKVLIVGGYNGSTEISTAELYDPQANTFSTTGSMTTARGLHTATPLVNNKVLITGGKNGSNYLSTAELYDIQAGTFSLTGSMNSGRCNHTATSLPDGKVLIAGGFSGSTTTLSTAELYSPAIGKFSSTGYMNFSRGRHRATLLPNGKVLITGGCYFSGAEYVLSTAELYDPVTGTFSTTGSMTTPRKDHTSILLRDGRVLISGGHNGSTCLSTAELYDPKTGTFSVLSSTVVYIRQYPSETLLPNGKVLITGGYNGSNYLSTAELYDPSLKSFFTTNSMCKARMDHTLTLLPDGRLLIVGGYDGSNYLSDAELVRYIEYDYTIYSSSMQPEITRVAGSEVFPIDINRDTVYTIEGNRFKGCSESSGGNYCQRNSPTNYPRVYLQRIDSFSGGIIDVSTSVYPMTSLEWSNADKQISFKTPSDLPVGYYLLYVVANTIPSKGVVVRCMRKSSYKTKVGKADGWIWDNAETFDIVPSGTSDNWQWQEWAPNSGRKVPQGSADNWIWKGE